MTVGLVHRTVADVEDESRTRVREASVHASFLAAPATDWMDSGRWFVMQQLAVGASGCTTSRCPALFLHSAVFVKFHGVRICCQLSILSACSQSAAHAYIGPKRGPAKVWGGGSWEDGGLWQLSQGSARVLVVCLVIYSPFFRSSPLFSSSLLFSFPSPL